MSRYTQMANLQGSIERTGRCADELTAHLEWRDSTSESWEVFGSDLADVVAGRFVPKRIILFMKRMRNSPGVWLSTSPRRGWVLRAWVRSPVEERFVRDVLAHAVSTVLSVADDLRWSSDRSSTRLMSVWYAPIGAAKQLPRQAGRILTCDNVNSGLTCFEDTAVSVFVYRREDACKVMMHELLHALGVDEAWRGSVDDNESYVDTLACYMHSLWAYRLGRLGRPASQGNPIGVEAALRTTRDHIMNVASRVERHFEGMPWLESTHARAYYVGKAALWHDLPAFLQLLCGLGNERVDPDALGGYLKRVRASRKFRSDMKAMSLRVTGRSLRMAPTEREIQHNSCGHPRRV